jgi:hypothetical protein
MPLAGFEPTIPVFKRVLDRAATVTGKFNHHSDDINDDIFTVKSYRHLKHSVP